MLCPPSTRKALWRRSYLDVLRSETGTLASEELVAVPEHSDGLVDHVVDDFLGGLDVVDDRRALAEEEALSGLCLLRALLVVVLEVVVDGNDALVRELLDLVRTRLPVQDVGRLEETQRTAGEDDGADVGLVRRLEHGLLVRLGSAGLLGGDESGADPDTVGAVAERSSETAAVVNTAGSHGDDGLAGQRALAAAADVDDAGCNDGEGNVTSVSTTLATLEDDHVDTGLEDLGGVLGVTNDTGHHDLGIVQLFDDLDRGHTDGGNEELGARLNDNVDELGELAVCVVGVGLSCATADLGQEKIDAEGSVLVGQVALELVHLLAEEFGGIADSSDDTDTTRIADGGSELGAGSDVPVKTMDAKE
ncbi:hypothetical protein L1887_50573 [Cichorium endivia]|nr:hypothetical protein L1887_50573 [Cichorium endivia]